MEDMPKHILGSPIKVDNGKPVNDPIKVEFGHYPKHYNISYRFRLKDGSECIDWRNIPEGQLEFTGCTVRDDKGNIVERIGE